MTVATSREDARARAAIERMTDRIMASPAPGTTRDSARTFVVGVAKRNDYLRPGNTLDDGRLTKSQARALVADQLELATLKQPRVQAAIKRFTARVAKAYPDLDAATRNQYATRRFLDAFMAHPRMLDLGVALYVDLCKMRVARRDARAALDQLLTGTVPDAVNAAEAGPLSVSVTVPAQFALHPARDLSVT